MEKNRKFHIDVNERSRRWGRQERWRGCMENEINDSNNDIYNDIFNNSVCIDVDNMLPQIRWLRFRNQSFEIWIYNDQR